MSQELQFSGDDLERSGGGVSASANDLASMVQSLQRELSLLGQPWSNVDRLGTVIGEAYLAICDHALSCLTTNISTMDGHGRSIQTLGTTVADGQAEAIDALRRLTEQA
jgi:hypothetical protein